MNREFSTPMMRQYMEIKREHEDCLLFFRLGDFYELFLDDAKVGAKVLDITLTRRPRGKDGEIPMAGVSHHAADNYIAKLVKAGYKVALCEQVTEPTGKGIVERAVVRIVTPGSILDEKSLSKKDNNYTFALSIGERSIGIAVADVSTGDFQTTEISINENLKPILENELIRFMPSECVISGDTYSDRDLVSFLKLQRQMNIYAFPEWREHSDNARTLLKDHFSISSLKTFGIDDYKEAQKACGALLGYLAHTQKDRIGHFKVVRWYTPDEFVELDRSTIINLELFSTIREREEYGSFVSVIDKTVTSMGGRLLKEWIRKPLTDKIAIEERLDAVENLLKEADGRSKMQKEMKSMYDVERILSRLSVGVGTPADLLNLKYTLERMLGVKHVAEKMQSALLKRLASNIHTEAVGIYKTIGDYIKEEATVDARHGGIIKEGIDPELDSIRKDTAGNREWMSAFEKDEREKTGIGSLKVKFNKVFGYYIEVTKSNVESVPEHYIRKQTMVNGERYITPELKEYEAKILKAEEKIYAREYELFLELVDVVLKEMLLLQEAAKSVSSLDCLISFTELSEEFHYTRPVIQERGEINIVSGKHPVVEILNGGGFVPNDALLNDTDHGLIVITGPNMAGKSVYMRQVALIVLMAHMGMFVPAESATIPIVDKLFVRSGAADSISSGLSTFMLEMVETAHILNNATHKSLVIMDEIGRGTTTYDGISIAWSVAEFLIREVCAKTLFATHYHELQRLEDEYPKRVTNYRMAVDNSGDEPVFIHRIEKGRAESSYAIVVARRAGIPEQVTGNAEKILKKLTQNSKLDDQNSNLVVQPPSLTFSELEDLDLDRLTPIDALKTLSNIKNRLYEGEKD